MLRLFKKAREDLEYCYNIETSEPLLPQEMATLKWLISETFEPNNFSENSLLDAKQKKIVELGPRLNFATAFSTNAVSICHACGLKKITRLERTRRYRPPDNLNQDRFIALSHDRMTECHYPEPLQSFATGDVPEPVYHVQLMEKGAEALKKINQECGLGMDDWDIQFYTNLFVNIIKRNPTNVECFQLGQANSEHSRHWFFKGKLYIDGQAMPLTLFQIIQSTLKANPDNSIIAYKDNSSAIKGYDIWTITPQHPGACSPFKKQKFTYHIIFTAETHNHPSGVAPFPGAETGTGGRLRDGQATGQGSLVIAGTAGYCVGNLNIYDYPIPGENPNFSYPDNLDSPLNILIEESNGASDYGNKFGEPVIQGFVRTFGQILPNNEHREWVKPIMFTGGVGQIDARHTEKDEPAKGMLIIQIGGPAYRIGFGGGSASSQISGDNLAELDFASVQRGDAEMENKENRVVRACVEMGNKNPVRVIHDQGAGGPCNVLSELVTPTGGKIKIRNIIVGDATMSVVEIWCAEYQERNALLIDPDRLAEFQAICQREKVNCEVLGEITGDGRIIIYDENDDTTPVDLDLNQILENVPQKEFHLERVEKQLKPLVLPNSLSVQKALELIFRLPSIGSKGYLVRKVDRSVTGLIAQQQCCGPLQLPVADVAVVAQSHFGLTGAAVAIGEQPIKMLVDVEAGARMAVAEALTNILWAQTELINYIKCSVNWMWAAKLAGEGSLLHDAAIAACDLMIKVGLAADGGKDSLSMAAKVGQETVKSPGQLVISAYAAMPDITKVITPDIKKPGQSKLMLIDLAPGKNRLGGSALAQAFDEIGDESPDVVSPYLLANAFYAIQQMIDDNLILSGHDRSDGGLITTLAEMIMPKNCGMHINLETDDDVIAQLFNEELGLVIEYLPHSITLISQILDKFGLTYSTLGSTLDNNQVIINKNDQSVFVSSTSTLIKWWESTSDRLEQEQMNLQLAKEQATTHDRTGPYYQLTFKPKPTPPELLLKKDKPKVAIIREEGSNGDREMTSAFFAAGFEPWDVTMTDLLEKKIKLNQFKGIVFVGGFSYADVLDSAKGWAGIIRFNSELKLMFDEFYQRKDTFSLGVCNGCQLMALLGWVPWSGLSETEQPRFIRNVSERFESRWATVKIQENPAIMLNNMTGSQLGIWVAHGEGRVHFPNPELLEKVQRENLAPIAFVDDNSEPTEQYPFNPNGSPQGITALCSTDGRHLAMMPHCERAFLKWQWPWMPLDWQENLTASPWLTMFQNAYNWCTK